MRPPPHHPDYAGPSALNDTPRPGAGAGAGAAREWALA
eukprot:gene11613-29310_t